MRIPFKIDTYEFTLATSYEELTTGEFFALRKSQENNIPSMLAALSGVPELIWDNVSSETAGVLFNPNAKGWFPLQYLYTKMDWNTMPVPETIFIDGEPVRIGKFSPSLKQKYLMQQAMERAAKASDHIDSAIEILAIYLQPIATKEPFSIEAATKFQEVIKQTKITEAFPTATFFLAKLIGLESAMPSTWLTRALQKKQLQESDGSKFSESLTPLMPLPMETSSSIKKFGIFPMRWFSRSSGKAKSITK